MAKWYRISGFKLMSKCNYVTHTTMCNILGTCDVLSVFYYGISVMWFMVFVVITAIVYIYFEN